MGLVFGLVKSQRIGPRERFKKCALDRPNHVDSLLERGVGCYYLRTRIADIYRLCDRIRKVLSDPSVSLLTCGACRVVAFHYR